MKVVESYTFTPGARGAGTIVVPRPRNGPGKIGRPTEALGGGFKRGS